VISGFEGLSLLGLKVYLVPVYSSGLRVLGLRVLFVPVYTSCVRWGALHFFIKFITCKKKKIKKK